MVSSLLALDRLGTNTHIHGSYLPWFLVWSAPCWRWTGWEPTYVHGSYLPWFLVRPAPCRPWLGLEPTHMYMLVTSLGSMCGRLSDFFDNLVILLISLSILLPRSKRKKYYMEFETAVVTSFRIKMSFVPSVCVFLCGTSDKTLSITLML